MALALDYSNGRPSGAAVRAKGYSGVIRYAGTPGNKKNITKTEYQDMDRNGVGVALVYENKAGDALNGRAAGVASATAAGNDARAIGFPSSRPIYLAVDQDITSQMETVKEYFRGANSILGVGRTGVYGEADVLDALFAAGLVTYGWQTAAWSKGRRAKKLHLFQKIGTAVVGGVDCDESDILATDWGQHNAGKVDMELSDKVKLVTWGPNAPENGNTLTVEAILARAEARLNNIETWLRPEQPIGEIASWIKNTTGVTLSSEQIGELANELAPQLGINYAALAKAVNDDAAARLKE